MFMEIVTTARKDAEFVFERSRIYSDPPAGLRAAISWVDGEDQVSLLTVWETPGARGDFALERMMPLFDAGVLDDRHGHPERLTPLRVLLAD
jgi:hypothetical protein